MYVTILRTYIRLSIYINCNDTGGFQFFYVCRCFLFCQVDHDYSFQKETCNCTVSLTLLEVNSLSTVCLHLSIMTLYHHFKSNKNAHEWYLGPPPCPFTLLLKMDCFYCASLAPFSPSVTDQLSWQTWYSCMQFYIM